MNDDLDADEAMKNFEELGSQLFQVDPQKPKIEQSDETPDQSTEQE